MMENHFHLLLRVRPAGPLDDAALLARLMAFYGPKGSLTTLAQQGLSERGQIDADVREHLLSRMGDISVFMQEFKQRFSRWYNRRHERDGTLWSERFRSMLIEDQPASVEAVAAYIDLNPVRAGLVADPKDYRFCGYAAAVAGNRLARKGLMSIQNGAHPGGMAALNQARTTANSALHSVAGVEAESRVSNTPAQARNAPHITHYKPASPSANAALASLNPSVFDTSAPDASPQPQPAQPAAPQAWTQAEPPLATQRTLPWQYRCKLLHMN